MIYSIDREFCPPLPRVDTWALGMQLRDGTLIDSRVVPILERRMERLDLERIDEFYEEKGDGGQDVSRKACMEWMQWTIDFLKDDAQVNGISLFEFLDRPEGFPEPNPPELSEKDAKYWKRCKVSTLNAIQGNQALHATPAVAAPATNRQRLSSPMGANEEENFPEGTQEEGNNDMENTVRSAGYGLGELDRATSRMSREDEVRAGVKAGLEYAGYPASEIHRLLEENLFVSNTRLRYPDRPKNVTPSWRIKLPNGKTINSFVDFLKNPYPGATVPHNLRCFKTPTCRNAFGHRGSCGDGTRPKKRRGRGGAETNRAAAARDETAEPSDAEDGIEELLPTPRPAKKLCSGAAGSLGLDTPMLPETEILPRSAPVVCGNVHAIWYRAEPTRFKVTDVPKGVQKPTEAVTGPELQRLANRSTQNDWKTDIQAKLNGGSRLALSTFASLGGLVLEDPPKPQAHPEATTTDNTKAYKYRTAEQTEEEKHEKEVQAKKQELKEVLAHAQYPPDLVLKILERGSFRCKVASDGKSCVRFKLKLPNGVIVRKQREIQANIYGKTSTKPAGGASGTPRGISGSPSAYAGQSPPPYKVPTSGGYQSACIQRAGCGLYRGHFGECLIMDRHLAANTADKSAKENGTSRRGTSSLLEGEVPVDDVKGVDMSQGRGARGGEGPLGAVGEVEAEVIVLDDDENEDEDGEGVEEVSLAPTQSLEDKVDNHDEEADFHSVESELQS